MEKTFSTDSGAYLRTTENINGYYDLLWFYNKTVLTVVGSGDQIFEAVLRGAKDVDGFDISINSILLYYLKEAAIKTMSYEEYINFFFVEHYAFSKEGYNALRVRLNPKAREYWDKVFQNDNPLALIEKMLVGKPTFYGSIAAAGRRLSLLSSYLEKDKYELLQELIEDMNIDIELRDVSEVDSINKTYDYIILSNIYEYQDSEEFKKLINAYQTKLNDDGQIIVGYAYHDIDLSAYKEFKNIKIPSRYMVLGNENAPEDSIMTTGKTK